eukprot:s61_g12.t1
MVIQRLGAINARMRMWKEKGGGLQATKLELNEMARFGALKAASLEDVGSAPIPRSESKDDFMDLGPDVVEDYMEDIVDFDAYNEL